MNQCARGQLSQSAGGGNPQDGGRALGTDQGHQQCTFGKSHLECASGQKGRWPALGYVPLPEERGWEKGREGGEGQEEGGARAGGQSPPW